MQENISLKSYNTLQIDVTAKYFMEIKNTYSLLQFLETKEWKENKHRILWWGSNTLFLNDYYDGIVLHPDIKGIETIKETETEIYLQVWAWEDRNEFVNYTINNGLWWIENLILIPGNVWTSAVSNIGAYWQEARETIYEIVWVNLETNTIQKISNDDCNFSYRNSIFKNELKDKFIITHVVYKLKKVDWDYEFKTSYKDVTAYFENNNIDFDNLSISEKLPTISKAIEVIRRNKLPDHTKLWTAWSYFKNPEISLPERDDLQTKFPELRAHLTENETMKLSAGQLIELCWWKWKEVNWVKMYEKHALILINSNPSWEVVAEYAQMVQDSVKEKFWVQLEPEVIYCK